MVTFGDYIKPPPKSPRSGVTFHYLFVTSGKIKKMALSPMKIKKLRKLNSRGWSSQANVSKIVWL